MLRSATALFALMAGIASLAGPPISEGLAALDLETGALPLSGLELVVVEAEGCLYCQIFRRDIAPAYEASDRGKTVPLRYADVNEVEAGSVRLEAPIDSVPTVLLLKGKIEIGRVPGYVGPENFFQSINRLISRSE